LREVVPGLRRLALMTTVAPEDLLPIPAPALAIEAVVHCTIRAVFLWTVPPTTSGLEHMNDSAQNPWVIPRFLTGSISLE
jgi:hypothetical protein